MISLTTFIVKHSPRVFLPNSRSRWRAAGGKVPVILRHADRGMHVEPRVGPREHARSLIRIEDIRGARIAGDRHHGIARRAIPTNTPPAAGLTMLAADEKPALGDFTAPRTGMGLEAVNEVAAAIRNPGPLAA
jgi:hypothetical protein